MESVEVSNLWISAKAVEAIVEEANQSVPYESGGMLFGYLNVEKKAVVVNVASIPGLKAKRKRHSYSPDQQYDVTIAAEMYNTSSAYLQYLGDWHSHSAFAPMMSLRDKWVLRKIACHKSARIDNPIMMIIGNLPDFKIAGWIWKQKKGRIFISDIIEDLKIKTFSRTNMDNTDG